MLPYSPEEFICLDRVGSDRIGSDRIDMRPGIGIEMAFGLELEKGCMR